MAPHFAIATRHPDDMEDTYLMTNIIPQTPNLNRGPWLELEMNVAKRYAQYRDEVWVICGPIYDDDETKRLNDKVSVPTACFKIVVDVTPEGHINLMSFVFPQDIDRNAELKDFLVSIDEVEERTGIDFLHMLKDEHEEKLEKWQPKRIWR